MYVEFYNTQNESVSIDTSDMKWGTVVNPHSVSMPKHAFMVDVEKIKPDPSSEPYDEIVKFPQTFWVNCGVDPSVWIAFECVSNNLHYGLDFRNHSSPYGYPGYYLGESFDMNTPAPADGYFKYYLEIDIQSFCGAEQTKPLDNNGLCDI